MATIVRVLAFVLVLAGAAAAQPLDGGALRIVVPYAPGGSSDRAARLLADALASQIGRAHV
jgi:tripartite-type tricarboxylate transporter receptor subunit TctC